MKTATVKLPDMLPWQGHVYHELARHNVITKGRRSGGTAFAADLALEKSLGGRKIGWLFDTYKRLRPVWRYLRSSLKPFIRNVDETGKYIELLTDGVIECWSADARVTARGRGYDWIMVTESAHIPDLREIWETELLPTLVETNGRSLFESSPNGHNYHAILHQRGEDPKFPDWRSWNVSTYENVKLDPLAINSLRSWMDESNFRQEILAQFVTRSGAVFPMFSRDIHVRQDLQIDHKLPIHVGIDFGFRHFAAVFGQITSEEEIHLIGEYGRQECTTEAALNGMIDLPHGNGDPFAARIGIIGCDPAGDARNLQTGRSDVSLVRRVIPQARVLFSTNPEYRSPEWGAARIRDLLRSAAGITRLYVSPECTNTIRMFENLVYPPHKEGHSEGQEPVKDGVNDHWFDALRYLLINCGMIQTDKAKGLKVSWR